METVKDIEWFKEKFAPYFKDYQLKYKFFKEGDFGSLNQVEFNSEEIDGSIDFWGLGWVGIHAWNNVDQKELLNVLHEPNEEEELEKSFNSLKDLVS